MSALNPAIRRRIIREFKYGRGKAPLAAERIIRKAKIVSTQVFPADRRKTNRFNDIRRCALDSPAKSRENKQVPGTISSGSYCHCLRPGREP